MACVGCGPSGARRDPLVRADFDCGDRRAEYTAAGTMAGEQGIRMFCKNGRPWVVRWVEPGGGGKRVEEGGVVDSSEWEKQWDDLNSSGWANLEDCVNPTAGEADPVYSFSIADPRQENEQSFLCQGVALPYPYDRIKNALDLAARLIGGR